MNTPQVQGKALGAVVTTNLAPLRLMIAEIQRQAAGLGTGVIDEMYRKWGIRHLKALFKRFVLFSRGGGNWPPTKRLEAHQRELRRRLARRRVLNLAGLAGAVKRWRKGLPAAGTGRKPAFLARTAPTTIRAARRPFQAIGGRSPRILIDTGTLLKGLQPGNPGNRFQRIPWGICVGYGGSAKHPKGRGKTIEQIASYHQNGTPKLPRRTIIVQPDDATVRGFTSDGRSAMMKLLRLCQQRGGVTP